MEVSLETVLENGYRHKVSGVLQHGILTHGVSQQLIQVKYTGIMQAKKSC